MPEKRPSNGTRAGRANKAKKKGRKAAQDGSHEEVLQAEINALLATTQGEEADENPDTSDHSSTTPLPEPGTEIQVDVFDLSSTGDGLARQAGSAQIYVVPYAVPGDTVTVKVFRHLSVERYSIADFISVSRPSPSRDDARVRCRYFTKCPGCQFQMLAYDEQLRHKRRVVERAYAHFSDLPPELVPAVGDTVASPLQYGYRTKLTPHFDGPPGSQRRRSKAKNGEPPPAWEAVPPVGFTSRGKREVLDIEDCPIGTDAVRAGMGRERERLTREFGKYTKGSTILLRESTTRVPKVEGKPGSHPQDLSHDAVRVETDDHVDYKTCITDNNATSTEYVDDFIFTNPAGSFFQNNNSILPPFTAYIRAHLLPPPTPSARPIRNLIDAYSGSGLFTITLSSILSSAGGCSIGIDIADKSIAFARRNASLNGLADEACRFIAADATELFKSVGDLDPAETVVVIDPPRKGCDASFLRQLLRFGPRRVVYVSCNVHTQARDVGILVRGEVPGGEEKENVAPLEDGEGEKKATARYDVESLRGFDFFPQTGHVESVAVLNRADA